MSASRQVVMAGCYDTHCGIGAMAVGSQMDTDPGYGGRVAAFLRRVYPNSRQKRIAADFDVSVSTAKNWLAGQCPQPHYLDRMRVRWGVAFDEALNPRPLESADALRTVVEQLAQRLEAPRRAIAKPTRRKPSAPVVGDMLGYRDDLFGGL